MGVLLVVSATGAGLALGVPLLIMPAPMVMASGLALFIDSWNMRDYILLVIGGLLTAVWFISHHFWYLDVDIGTVSLKRLCVGIVTAGMMSVLVPGMALSEMSPVLVSAAALVQSALLCLLEEHLYASSLTDPDSFYPPFLVVATSALGLAMANMLRSCGSISELIAWALQCLFISKLSMLLIPEARLFFPCLAVTLAMTPPVLLYRGKPGRRATMMNKAQGIAHGLFMCGAVAYARFAVFDLLKVVNGVRPSEGLLIGSLVLLVGAGCIPMAFIHFSYSSLAKKIIIGLCAVGSVIALLEPPFPVQGGAECPRLPFHLCPRLWDEGHVPEHEQDDLNIYGDSTARMHWAKWLLVAGVAGGIAGISAKPAREGILAKVACALASGACVGAYIALELFPGQLVMQLLISVGTLMTGIFLVFLYSPSSTPPTFVPAVFIALVLLLPVSVIIQSELPVPQPAEVTRMMPDVRRDLREEAQTALLFTYAAYFLLIAFTIKVKVAIPTKSFAPQKLAPSIASIRRPAQMLHHMAPSMLAKSSGTPYANWVPTAGNLATLLCFLISLSLALRLSDSSDLPIFAMAPILLLLNRDPIFLKDFSDRQRYAPVQVALASYLSLCAVVETLGHLLPISQSITAIDPTTASVLKNLLTLGLTLPVHYLFATFLWTRRRLGEGWLLLLTPLNIPALVLTDINPVRMLAVLGIFSACVQFFFGRYVRRVGNRIL